METVMVGVEILRRALCRCGPYLFVELVMPGGTLLALLMYLYQRRAMKKESGIVDFHRWSNDYRTHASDAGGAEGITFKEIRRCASW